MVSDEINVWRLGNLSSVVNKWLLWRGTLSSGGGSKISMWSGAKEQIIQKDTSPLMRKNIRTKKSTSHHENEYSSNCPATDSIIYVKAMGCLLPFTLYWATVCDSGSNLTGDRGIFCKGHYFQVSIKSF